jgi:hypothetical protein
MITISEERIRCSVTLALGLRIIDGVRGSCKLIRGELNTKSLVFLRSGHRYGNCVLCLFLCHGGQMYIKCQRLMDGPGPSEAIVSVRTTKGEEEVVVYTGLLSNGCLNVGPRLIDQPDRVLVELPREAASGRWRVWIPTSEVVERA